MPIEKSVVTSYGSSFAVVSKSQRLLHLRAETKSEVEKWSRAIEMHADLTKVAASMCRSSLALNVVKYVGWRWHVTCH